MPQQAIATPPPPHPSRRVMLPTSRHFRLGHLRRSRALATALTAGDKPGFRDYSHHGSPVAGRFTFPERSIQYPPAWCHLKLPDRSYVKFDDWEWIFDSTTNLRRS